MEEQTETNQTLGDGNRQRDAPPNDLREDVLRVRAQAELLEPKALPGGGVSPPLPQYSSRLPDALKISLEQLSGVPMDDVIVHYNSPLPAHLQALAYAQGDTIYLGPGQEQHLAHEAWHVVQQKQGRVKPTGEHQGALINTDTELEREAQSMARLLGHVQGEACFSTVGSLAVPVSGLLSQRPSTASHPFVSGRVIQCVLEVAVATGKDDRPIYESAASALGVIELQGLKCRDTSLQKAYQVVSVSVEKGQLTLEDVNKRGTFFIYTVATGVYSPLRTGSTAFSDEVKKKEVKVKDSSSDEEESFSMATATAVNPQEYTVGVLGFLYHGEPLRAEALTVSPSGIRELTQIMTEIRGKQKAVFFNMFAPPTSSIPINDSVSGRHLIGSIQNMAEAWLGQKVSNPRVENQRRLSTSQGAILLQFRALARKEGASSSLGTEVRMANLEISVQPSGSTSWTKIVDLHIDPS